MGAHPRLLRQRRSGERRVGAGIHLHALDLLGDRGRARPAQPRSAGDHRAFRRPQRRSVQAPRGGAVRAAGGRREPGAVLQPARTRRRRAAMSAEAPARPSASRAPGFRRLASAWVFTNLADSALFLMAAVWVKELTGSDVAGAFVFVALGLPAVLAPFLGMLADRLPRKRLLVASNLVL